MKIRSTCPYEVSLFHIVTFARPYEKLHPPAVPIIRVSLESDDWHSDDVPGKICIIDVNLSRHHAEEEDIEHKSDEHRSMSISSSQKTIRLMSRGTATYAICAGFAICFMPDNHFKVCVVDVVTEKMTR